MKFLAFLGICALSLLLHEAGHVAMAFAWGVKVKRVGISMKGLYIVREKGEPFSNAAIALAGPMVNLLLALIFETAAPEFSLINSALGICNLLPFPGSDGRRAIAVLLVMHRQVWQSPGPKPDDPGDSGPR